MIYEVEVEYNPIRLTKKERREWNLNETRIRFESSGEPVYENGTN